MENQSPKDQISFLKDEKFWAFLLGSVGCVALAWNLVVDPSDWPDIIVNFAQIGVAVIVFLIANNIFKGMTRNKTFGFNEKFEEYLKQWASINKYLIDASNINVEKNEEGKRTIDMIVNHENIVKATQPASSISGTKNKGAFLYLPLKNDINASTMQFKINKSMFSHRSDMDYDKEKNQVITDIINRINGEFKSIGIQAGKSKEAEKIEVDFSQMDKNEENAKKLIDVVEFVKTLFLAIA